MRPTATLKRQLQRKLQSAENKRQKSTHATGLAYEQACASALRASGWLVRTTRTSGDFGADLVCRTDGVSMVVQCKAYSKPAGISAVQQAHAAMSHYRTTQAAVMCDAGFTQAARSLAASTGVGLLSSRSAPAPPKRHKINRPNLVPSRQYVGPSTLTRHEFRPPSPPVPRENENLGADALPKPSRSFVQRLWQSFVRIC
ncbi:restriction endonuclease [Acetobacter aceti]|uniref:restriction endonuclease n=1 Tax=Acetobacter aceti TaxID=435 RepID=UPI000C074700